MRRPLLALCSGLVSVLFAATGLAQTAATAPSAPVSVSFGASAPDASAPDAESAAASASPETEKVDEWVTYDTGGEDADYGFAVFGGIGLGHRLNDPPNASGDDVDRDGLRLAVTGLFRPIRWLGVGVGYEHADLERDQGDGVDGSFENVSREIETLWFNLRAYPLRLDPVAFYIDLGAGPTWQSVAADGLVIDPANASASTPTQCSASGSAGVGLKSAVGVELGLVSGLMMYGELGPDHYLLDDASLDGCQSGAGDATLFGFRAGFAFGFEHTRVLREPPPAPPVVDTDGDTIADPADACREVAGVANADPAKNGCPPDTDGDTIPDAVDACVTVPGIASEDRTKHGCPPDTDGDGFADPVDACRELPGVASEDPAKNGCPPDTDGDGFRDDQDACPQEKGGDDPDPSKRGCPKLVRVTEKEIVILEQVQFDTAKATIKPASDPLLDSVAQVLVEHPEILRLEVQGHTDSKGNKRTNTKLSNERAKSVKAALEKRGVAAERLVAMGYGPDKPIGDNKTDEGRAMNRRVQFVVLEKRPNPVLRAPSGLAPKPADAGATQPAAPAPTAPTAPAPTAPAAPAPTAPAAPAPAAPAPGTANPTSL
jgi:OOP family OmpA-OmpF porin